MVMGVPPMRGAKAAALNFGTPLKGAEDECDLVVSRLQPGLSVEPGAYRPGQRPQAR